jgi:hypothetical protein
MVANGDAHKPIWISEAAWNPVDAPEVPSDLPGRESYGAVTREQAAAYLPLAYQRAEEEWSWIGVINYWFFKRADDSERDQPFYYFRMVEPDFTPLPIYESMRQYTATRTPALYRGAHQADHWAIALDGAEAVSDEAAQFGSAQRVSGATFTAHGTHVLIRWRGERLTSVIDGTFTTEIVSPDPSAWTETFIFRSLAAETHTIGLEADSPFLLDGVTVDDRTALQLAPLVAGALIGIGMLVGSIGYGVWLRRSQYRASGKSS